MSKYALIKNRTDKIRLHTLCLCFFPLFMFANPDPYFGIADYYLFLLGFIGFASVVERKLVINKYTIPLCFIALWFCVSFVISLVSGELSSGYFLSYMMYILVLFVINSIFFSKREIEVFVKCYVFSAIIICAIIILFSYDFYGGGNERNTIKIFSNDPIDPNHLAAYLVVPFIIVYGKMIKRFQIKNLILLLILFVGMLSTASRGAMLSAVVGAFLTTYVVFKNNKKIKKLLLVILALTIGGVIAIKFIPANSLVRVFDFGNYRDASNSKRILNWLFGLRAFCKNPLIGYGFRSEMSIIQGTLGSNRIAHNTYIAFLLQFGSVGVILFIFFFFSVLKKCKNNGILLGSLIGTLLVCVFVSAEVATFFWLPLIFACLVSKYETETKTVIL